MEPWQKFWVEGVLPQATEEQKRRLKEALEKDSETLLMGVTALSREDNNNPNLEAGACCPIAYAGWNGTETVRQMEDIFWKICIKADQLTGMHSGFHKFISWWDTSSRTEAIQELLKLM